MGAIRRCERADLAAILAIVNDAAQAYRDHIPADRWHEPYMPADELERELAAGVAFAGYEEAGTLLGVMGVQDVRDVTLIRHAYVTTTARGRGIGGVLLAHLLAGTTRPVLIGTWAAATWAIGFYEKHGFRLVSPSEKERLLRAYWSIPDRQIETSVVLVDTRWRRLHPSPDTPPAAGGPPMKLYYHPASTTSRIVMLCAAEEKIDLEYQVVDLFTGEHLKPPYTEKNPSCLVPMIEDGSFRLTESSTIVKFLAEQAGSAAYPKELRARAKVNEMMDWFNTNLYRDFAYGLVYPQAFPTHKRRSDEAQAATLEWGKEKSKVWLKILDQNLIGSKKPYLLGDAITVADYLGAEMVGLGELIRCNYSAYPNVERWMRNMKALKSWAKVHEVFYGFAASVKDTPFVAI